MALAHSTAKRLGKPHKPPLWPDYWIHSYLHPLQETSSLLLGEEQGDLLLVLAPLLQQES